MKLLNEIQQNLNCPKNLYNKFGNYSYRSAEAILEAVKPLLGDAVLTISDEIVHFPVGEESKLIEIKDSKGSHQEIIGADRFYIKATAYLKTGDEQVSVSAYAREAENKKGMDDAQITGSASSYARKYALNGLFLIDDTKDADTMDNTAKPTPKKVEPKVSKTDEQKIEIGKLLEIHNPLMETPEEYRETCGKITGFELIEANFEEILNHLKKK